MMAKRKVAGSRGAAFKRIGARVLAVGLACALLWFAVEGGEYGTRALFRQHAKKEQLEIEVAALRQEVDSLEKEKTAILTNDGVLERIAREQYGMLHGSKELLFWMNNARASKDSGVAPDASTNVRPDTLSDR